MKVPPPPQVVPLLFHFEDGELCAQSWGFKAVRLPGLGLL